MAEPMEITDIKGSETSMEIEDVKSPEYLSDREEEIDIKFDPSKVRRLIIHRNNEFTNSVFDEPTQSLTIPERDVEYFAQYMKKLPNVHSVEIPIVGRHLLGLYTLTRMNKGIRFFEFHKYPQIDTLLLDAMTYQHKELPYIVHTPNLKTLSLQSNGIGDIGAKYLAKQSNLLSLDIRHNGITDKGARYFLFNKTLVELQIAEGNQITPFLRGAIDIQIANNRRVLQTIQSVAPVIVGALRPQLVRNPLRYSMLDLTKEISRMLGHEGLARTELSRLFTIDVPLIERQEPTVGTKRKFE